MRTVRREIVIYCSFVFMALLANTIYAVRLEKTMKGNDMVIKCLLPKNVYTGSYKLNWVFRNDHGIITTCRPNVNRLCLPPSVESTEWKKTHKFESIPGGASLRIIHFKNRTKDEEFTCRFYNGSGFSAEISFSVKSMYEIIQIGDKAHSNITTPQIPVTKTTEWTSEDNDNVIGIIFSVLFVASLAFNIAVIIYLCRRRKNTGSTDRNQDTQPVPNESSSHTELLCSGSTDRNQDTQPVPNESSSHTELLCSGSTDRKQDTQSVPNKSNSQTESPCSATNDPCVHSRTPLKPATIYQGGYSPTSWKQATIYQGGYSPTSWKQEDVTFKSQEKQPLLSKSGSNETNDNRATKGHVQRKTQLFEENDALTPKVKPFDTSNVSEEEEVHKRKMIVNRKPSDKNEGYPQNNGNTDTHGTKSDKQIKYVENENTKDELKNLTQLSNYDAACTNFNVKEERNTENTQNDNGNVDKLSIGHSEEDEQRQYEFKLPETPEEDGGSIEEDDNSPATSFD